MGPNLGGIKRDANVWQSFRDFHEKSALFLGWQYKMTPCFGENWLSCKML